MIRNKINKLMSKNKGNINFKLPVKDIKKIKEWQIEWVLFLRD